MVADVLNARGRQVLQRHHHVQGRQALFRVDLRVQVAVDHVAPEAAHDRQEAGHGRVPRLPANGVPVEVRRHVAGDLGRVLGHVVPRLRRLDAQVLHHVGPIRKALDIADVRYCPRAVHARRPVAQVHDRRDHVRVGPDPAKPLVQRRDVGQEFRELRHPRVVHRRDVVRRSALAQVDQQALVSSRVRLLNVVQLNLSLGQQLVKNAGLRGSKRSRAAQSHARLADRLLDHDGHDPVDRDFLDHFLGDDRLDRNFLLDDRFYRNFLLDDPLDFDDLRLATGRQDRHTSSAKRGPAAGTQQPPSAY